MTIEMENQSNSTAKVMKKIKVDSFMIVRNKIVALCITGSDISNPNNYEDKIVDIHEFTSFLRRKSYSSSYRPETMHPLMCADLAHFINEKEGRTEEMEEPRFEEPIIRHQYQHPVNQLFDHMNDAIKQYDKFSL